MWKFCIKIFQFHSHDILTRGNEIKKRNATYVPKQFKPSKTMHAIQNNFDAVIIREETKFFFHSFFLRNDEESTQLCYMTTDSISQWSL